MTGRERLLTAINNQRPDRLPCQVHSWMSCYLKTVLNGMDQYQAYEHFGMDPVIYVRPEYEYSEKDLSNWNVSYREAAIDADGNTDWVNKIVTPEGELTEKGSYNRFTGWITEHLIKNERDFELWNRYVPVPEKLNWTPVLEAKKRIGEKGIVRSAISFMRQGSPWQSFAVLYPIEDAILATYDNPDWVHFALDSILQKSLRMIERAGKIPLDLVETGGGAGSSTVISPELHKKFCLPYDQKQHEALHAADTQAVYHLCGGLMPLLDIVAENGADGLETMTPPGMGGDCDLAEADKRIGKKLFFIGGFDQNAGFENGNPQLVRDMVFKLFRSCTHGGYICSPSDHFFTGKPENIRAFVEAIRECIY